MLSVLVINKRIAGCIARFYDQELQDLYDTQGWQLPSWQKTQEVWNNTHFRVTMTDRYQDGAFQTCVFTLLNVPGYYGKEQIGCLHSFQFTIPRHYPEDLQLIEIVNITPLWHLRVPPQRTKLKACYIVNGDIDAILRRLIDFVLLKPEVVLPKNADMGHDQEMARWYLAHGPQQVYNHLMELWGTHQIPITIIKKPPKVMILQ